MQSKVEVTQTPENQSPNTNGQYLTIEQQSNLWRYSNMGFTALCTSTAIAFASEPLNKALTYHAMHGRFIPTNIGLSSLTGATFTFLRSMYCAKATATAVYGGTAKSTIAVHGKTKALEEGHSKTIEEIHTKTDEEAVFSKNHKSPMQGLAFTVSADYLVTKPSATYANLQRAKLIPEGFSVRRNVGGLLRSNMAATLTSSSLNFYMMLVFQQQIADKMSYINNKDTRNLCSGILSGILAAGVTLPFSTWIDRTSIRTTVNSNGKLVNPSVFTLTKQMTQEFAANPKKILWSMAETYPIRALRVAMIFATVAVVTGKLGNAPLENVIPVEFQPSVSKTKQDYLAKKPLYQPVSATPQSFFKPAKTATKPEEITSTNEIVVPKQ